MRRLSRILLVTSTSLGAMCSATMAQAQDTGSADEVVGEDIVVTGIRASLESARNIKLNSSGIVDSIARQEIGRASCRERVCQYVEISEVPESLQKKSHANAN